MDDLLIAVRAIVSLAAVLGVLLWVTHRLKKRQTGGAAPRPALPRPLARLTALIPARSERTPAASRQERITVVARSGLGGKAQLVVAEFGGIRYVLGVTEHGISVVDTQETSSEWDADAGTGESPLKSVA
ncbi:MAG: flagellar biosynthetic protein FliO [Microbacterium sp.]